jgi:hypothetical protein
VGMLNIIANTKIFEIVKSPKKKVFVFPRSDGIIKPIRIIAIHEKKPNR